MFNHSILEPVGAPMSGSLAFPLWIIPWWCHIHAISEAQMSWNEALGFLDQLKRREPLSQELIALFLALHWNVEVPSALGGNSTTSTMTMTTLAHYCRQKWLKTCHLEQMTAILQHRLENAGLQGVMIAKPTLFQSLTTKYRNSDENENFQVSQRLISGSLSRLGFAVCVRMDHRKTVLEIKRLKSGVTTGLRLWWTLPMQKSGTQTHSTPHCLPKSSISCTGG